MPLLFDCRARSERNEKKKEMTAMQVRFVEGRFP